MRAIGEILNDMRLQTSHLPLRVRCEIDDFVNESLMAGTALRRTPSFIAEINNLLQSVPDKNDVIHKCLQEILAPYDDAVHERLPAIFEYIQNSHANFSSDELVRHGIQGNINREYNGKTPLLVAIESKNLAAVKWLLANNADPGVADEIGIKPLMAIVKVDDPDIRKEVYQNFKTKSWSKFLGYIKALFDQGIPTKLITTLDLSKSEPDQKKNTALMAAIKSNQFDIALILLNNGQAPIDLKVYEAIKIKKDMNDKARDLYQFLLNYKDKAGNSLTYLAYKALDPKLLESLLAENAYVDSTFYRTAREANNHPELYAENIQQMHKLLSEHYRNIKKSIIELGSFFQPAKEKQPLSTIEAITSQMYLYLKTDKKEERLQLIGEVRTQLEKIYGEDDNALMKPLLDVIGLAALGKHNHGSSKDKKFKIVASSETIRSLQPGVSVAVEGLYSLKNTAFVGRPENLLRIALHESTHFAMRILFESKRSAKYI